MPRIPDLVLEKLSAEQRRAYDAIVSGPRGRVVGPLRVWLESPQLADHAQALGAFCRFGTSLPPRLSELAIITAGAFWRASFEWHAHAPMAIKAGIDMKFIFTKNGDGRNSRARTRPGFTRLPANCSRPAGCRSRPIGALSASSDCRPWSSSSGFSAITAWSR